MPGAQQLRQQQHRWKKRRETSAERAEAGETKGRGRRRRPRGASSEAPRDLPPHPLPLLQQRQRLNRRPWPCTQAGNQPCRGRRRGQRAQRGQSAAGGCVPPPAGVGQSMGGQVMPPPQRSQRQWRPAAMRALSRTRQTLSSGARLRQLRPRLRRLHSRAASARGTPQSPRSRGRRGHGRPRTPAAEAVARRGGRAE